jgi:hypothetical protein
VLLNELGQPLRPRRPFLEFNFGKHEINPVSISKEINFPFHARIFDDIAILLKRPVASPPKIYAITLVQRLLNFDGPIRIFQLESHEPVSLVLGGGLSYAKIHSRTMTDDALFDAAAFLAHGLEAVLVKLLDEV